MNSQQFEIGDLVQFVVHLKNKQKEIIKDSLGIILNINTQKLHNYKIKWIDRAYNVVVNNKQNVIWHSAQDLKKLF